MKTSLTFFFLQKETNFKKRNSHPRMERLTNYMEVKQFAGHTQPS